MTLLACSSSHPGPGDGGPPPGDDWESCEAPADCVVRASSCCGVCGAPSLGDVDGVHRDRTENHFAEVCPAPEPCPDCPSASNPELVATCRAGRCVAVDIGLEDLTACATDDDCAVRTRDCCECGGDTSRWNLIAVRRDMSSSYGSLVCDGMTDCGGCLPTYPSDVTAACGADGHCEIAMP